MFLKALNPKGTLTVGLQSPTVLAWKAPSRFQSDNKQFSGFTLPAELEKSTQSWRSTDSQDYLEKTDFFRHSHSHKLHSNQILPCPLHSTPAPDTTRAGSEVRHATSWHCDCGSSSCHCPCTRVQRPKPHQEMTTHQAPPG